MCIRDRYTGVSLTIADSSNNSHGVYFDLSAGTFTTSGVNYNGKMDAYPNGWYRCFATLTSTGAGPLSQRCLIGVLKDGSTHTYAGDGTSGIYIWGAQLESGSTASSFIPTYGYTQARGPDVVQITGEEFSDFYNQIEGTIFLSASYDTDARAAAIVTIDDTSNTSEYTELGYRAGGASANNVAAYIRTDSGNDQYYKNWTSSATEGNEFKIGLAYKNNDYASSANGESAHTDTSGTTSKVYDRLRFNHVDSVSPPIASSYIRRFIYYSKRLPNSQLTTLTA
mgnify:CR=1 FL=1